MADTVRLTNLKYIQTILQGMDLTGPNDTTSPTPFSKVVMGPLADSENRFRYSVGIVVGDEIKKVLYPITECILPVTVEFRMTWNTGDQLPAEEAERLLGTIETALVQDYSLGGNAISLKPVGNAVTLDIYSDKDIIGAIHFELQYRHATLDLTAVV